MNPGSNVDLQKNAFDRLQRQDRGNSLGQMEEPQDEVGSCSPEASTESLQSRFVQYPSDSTETRLTSSLARPEGLGRKSGWLHLALYLKASLQKAYAGDKVKPELLPVPVSLTRSGYPRIIPSFHRRFILRKDDRATILVQLYLSFFSLSILLPSLI